MGNSEARAAVGQQETVGSRTLEVERFIGEGGFAYVFLVVDRRANERFVVKRMVAQGQLQATVERELEMLRTINHPNVVRYIDANSFARRGATTTNLVLEYCAGGHLFDKIKNLRSDWLRQYEVLDCIKAVASALECIHQMGYAHRDIKLENILIDTAGNYKLCDFGSAVRSPIILDSAEARAAEEENIDNNTTPCYRAPEMCDLLFIRELTTATDMWALGCVLFAVAFKIHPFQDLTNLGILSARVTIPDDSPFSESLHELIMRLLTPEPELRLTATELLEHIACVEAQQELPPRKTVRTQPDPSRQQRGSMQTGSPRNSPRGGRSPRKRPTGSNSPARSSTSGTSAVVAKRLAERSQRTPEADSGGSGAFWSDIPAADLPPPAAPTAAFAPFDSDPFANAPAPTAASSGFSSDGFGAFDAGAFDSPPAPATSGFDSFDSGAFDSGGFDATAAPAPAAAPGAAPLASEPASLVDLLETSSNDPIQVARRRSIGGGSAFASWGGVPAAAAANEHGSTPTSFDDLSTTEQQQQATKNIQQQIMQQFQAPNPMGGQGQMMGMMNQQQMMGGPGQMMGQMGMMNQQQMMGGPGQMMGGPGQMMGQMGMMNQQQMMGGPGQMMNQQQMMGGQGMNQPPMGGMGGMGGMGQRRW